MKTLRNASDQSFRTSALNATQMFSRARLSAGKPWFRLEGARQFRLGLRTKIILWAFVPTAIILLLVASVTYLSYQRVTERLVLERAREVTRLAANQIGATLREYTNQLEDEARADNLYLADVLLRQIALERSHKRLFLFDGGLLLLDSQGHVINTTPQLVEYSGSDWSREQFFLDLIQTNRPSISDRIIERGGLSRTLAVAVPMSGSDGHELWGALVGLIQLGESSISTFYGDIVRLRISQNGISYLVDEWGQIIYHTDIEKVGIDFSPHFEVQQVLGAASSVRAARNGDPPNNEQAEGRVGAFRTSRAYETEVVVGFAPIPGTAWGLVSEAKWRQLLSDSQEFQPYLLALLFLGIIAPALFVAVGVRRITDPINRLIEATRTIAAGDFSQKIETNSGDEIEILAIQFNNMSRQLQTSYGMLERRVVERTRELTALNDMAEAVNRSLELDETLQQALTKTREALKTDGGGIYLFEASNNQLVLAAVQGLDQPLVEQIETLAPGEGFNGFVAESGCPLAVDDVGQDPRRSPNAPLDTGISSLICVPLCDKHRVVGTLFAAEFRARVFSDQDLSMLTAIGHHAATAIENARLYQQAQRLAVLEERSRLARSLHDSVTQSLYSLTLLAAGWRRIAASGKLDNAIEALDELGALGKQALREMRLLIYELRPPELEKEGLLGALHKRLSAVEQRAGIDARLIADDILQLPAADEEALYWIAQEALSNALKHSGASQVWVRIHTAEGPGKPMLAPAVLSVQRLAVANRRGDEQPAAPQKVVQTDRAQFVLEIQDNGKGFAVEDSQSNGGLGLTSMRERAESINAEVTIEAAPGWGTLVRVCLPLVASQTQGR